MNRNAKQRDLRAIRREVLRALHVFGLREDHAVLGRQPERLPLWTRQSSRAVAVHVSRHAGAVFPRGKQTGKRSDDRLLLLRAPRPAVHGRRHDKGGGQTLVPEQRRRRRRYIRRGRKLYEIGGPADGLQRSCKNTPPTPTVENGEGGLPSRGVQIHDRHHDLLQSRAVSHRVRQGDGCVPGGDIDEESASVSCHRTHETFRDSGDRAPARQGRFRQHSLAPQFDLFAQDQRGRLGLLYAVHGFQGRHRGH